MSILKYGSYTFSVTPSVSLRRLDTLRGASGDKIGTTETWLIKGYLKGSSENDLKNKTTSMLNAFSNDGLDLQLLTNDQSTVLESMLASSLESGPQIINIDFLEGPAAWATNRPFTIQLQGESYTNTGIVDSYYDIIYSYDQHNKMTRVKKGFAQTETGTSAEATLNNYDPGIPTPWIRKRKDVQINSDDTRLDYTFSDHEQWKALPNNVSGGDYSTDVQYDENGGGIVSISGTFYGPGAEEAIIDLMPDEPLLSHRIIENEYDGSTTFQFSYQITDERLITESRETIIYQQQLTDFRLIPLMNGRIVKQKTGQIPAQVIQTGYRIGKFAYPPANLPLYIENTRDHRITKEAPLPSANERPTSYKISWYYAFEFETDPFNVLEPIN